MPSPQGPQFTCPKESPMPVTRKCPRWWGSTSDFLKSLLNFSSFLGHYKQPGSPSTKGRTGFFYRALGFKMTALEAEMTQIIGEGVGVGE